MAYNLLKGKKGIIFGALNDQSIAWKTAQFCFEEGAQIVLTNAPIALRMGEINKLAEECGNAPVIGADVTNMDDLKALFEKSMEHFGGKIDFILHSVGMSLNIRKGFHYTGSSAPVRRRSSGEPAEAAPGLLRRTGADEPLRLAIRCEISVAPIATETPKLR